MTLNLNFDSRISRSINDVLMFFKLVTFSVTILTLNDAIKIDVFFGAMYW